METIKVNAIGPPGYADISRDYEAKVGAAQVETSTEGYWHGEDGSKAPTETVPVAAYWIWSLKKSIIAVSGVALGFVLLNWFLGRMLGPQEETDGQRWPVLLIYMLTGSVLAFVVGLRRPGR